jgi:hypothetical protein
MRLADLAVSVRQVVGGAWRHPEADGEPVLDKPGWLCTEGQRQQTKDSQKTDHAHFKVDPEKEGDPPECTPK